MEHPVTLPEMLDAREQRMMRQQSLLRKYNCTLLCFTMNIAGPVKNSSLIRRGFAIGNSFLKERITAEGIRPLHSEEVNEYTGNEAYYLFDEPAESIKKLTVSIEEATDLGRLFDMDVLASDGTKADRTDLGFPARRCLICGKPAKECARSRTHTVEELQCRTTQILNDFIVDYDTEKAAGYACRALLYEVCTTPKPGLVDRSNNGSHKDMNIFTFIDSTCALHSYFKTCTRIGRDTASLSPDETFRLLRQAGKQAETDMLTATGGVNTHKGAVFSVGIICGALGRLPYEKWSSPDVILAECASITKGLTANDFAGLTPENAVTTGQKLYLNYKITGIRGQVEAGFPAVRDAGLPVLKEGIRRGYSINDAGCAALIALITAATDTNLIARSDYDTQQRIVERLKELILQTPYPGKDALEALDQDFIKKNLSPGGSADLLAVCYLLYFLENEEV